MTKDEDLTLNKWGAKMNNVVRNDSHKNKKKFLTS